MKKIIVKVYDITKPKELTNYQNDPPAFRCIGKVKYK